MRLRNVRFIGPLILLAILATSTRFLLLAPNGPVACLASLLSPYPRLVFIDLGANDGDSFKVFLGEDKSLRWSYKFPKPCGARYGDFEAVLVEANPRFDVVLASLKANMSERTPPIRVEIVGRSVVGTKDGPTPFGIDETVRENCNNCVGLPNWKTNSACNCWNLGLNHQFSAFFDFYRDLLLDTLLGKRRIRPTKSTRKSLESIWHDFFGTDTPKKTMCSSKWVGSSILRGIGENRRLLTCFGLLSQTSKEPNTKSCLTF